MSVLPILPSKSLTILHISDLHLTTRDLKEESLWKKLWKLLFRRLAPEENGWKILCKSPVLKNIDLCVISGDLPRRSPRRRLYRALRKELDVRFPCVNGRRRWIAVPGNHDRRFLGNFILDKHTFELGMGEDWKQAWWDPEYPCIVIPLDSNPKKAGLLRARLPLARGVLGDECNRISAEFQSVKESVQKHFVEVLAKKTAKKAASCAVNLCAAFDADEIRKLRRAAYPKVGEPAYESVPCKLIDRTAEALACLYMARAVKCVVLHHHPIGVRGTENIGILHSDAYLLLADSGAFLQSARDNQISLVLHGHKHVPHRIAVHLPEQDIEEVGIVGAGSSTQRSKHASATANLITINKAGEVEVELYDPWAHDWSRQASSVHLRKWSQIRKHLSVEANQCARFSSEDTQVDVSVLPYGDAIMTVEMHGLTVHQKPGQSPPRVLEIPISYKCPTQIGPVQVTCQIEGQDSQWRQVASHLHREPGYGPGEWHGAVKIEPTAPEQATPLTLTTRFIVFTTFAMNSWQAGFMYANRQVPRKEFWHWRCRVPVRKQLFAALETTGVRASAATFEKLYSTYRRIDDHVDEKERNEIVMDRAASGQRVAFTVPTPVWGSEYGIGWEWGGQSSLKCQTAPVFTPFREQLEAEASEARSASASPLRSMLQSLLRKIGTELEVTLYVLTRPAGDNPGKLIQIAWNQTVERSTAYGFEMNFGTGVAGRAASLQKTVAWVPQHPCATSADRMVDFYLPHPQSSGHTGILAVPIPRTQPLVILSIASRREDDTFSCTLQGTLRQKGLKKVKDCPQFTDPINRLYDRINDELKRAQSGSVGDADAKSGGDHTPLLPIFSDKDERKVVGAGVAQTESGRWDDAILPVNPDEIQRQLQGFEFDLVGDKERTICLGDAEVSPVSV